MMESSRTPLVSAIIPAYNRSWSIETTVVSVVNNDYRPIEIVIVDDGSTDDTSAVVRKLIEEHSSDECEILYIRQANSGACSARNNGLRRSSGAYVFFLDSDDTVSDSKISKQVAVLENNDVDVCVSDFSIYYRNTPNSPDKYQTNSNFLWKMLNNGSVGCATSLMRTELAQSINWTESLSNYQDIDYFLKVMILAKNVKHLPESTYRYIRFNEDSITTAHVEKSVPYKKRLLSLFTDCMFNFSYNKGFVPRILATYAILRISITAVISPNA